MGLKGDLDQMKREEHQPAKAVSCCSQGQKPVQLVPCFCQRSQSVQCGFLMEQNHQIENFNTKGEYIIPGNQKVNVAFPPKNEGGRCLLC